MVFSSERWGETWRVLGYSAAAALAFVALERLEFALLDAVGADAMLALTRDKSADDRLAAEARDIATRSSARALPPETRVAAFRVGYEVGWASHFAGSFAMSDPGVRSRAAAVADAHLALARVEASRIGIDADEVVALPSRTLADFVRLQERIEADESGLAARVEARLTPLHRHLFLLGASVGSDAAKVQSSGGALGAPQVASIRRHATLAGVAPAAWRPLVVDTAKMSAPAALEQHRLAVEGLLAALAAAPVAGGAPAPR
jgi:hypothetical protein